MTEQEIIRRSRKGDPRACRELVDRYAPMLMGVCLRYMKEKMLAEDVLQETFILIFKNLDQYAGDGAFGGWLRRIAVTTSLKSLRKKHVQTEELTADTELQDIIDPEVDIDMGVEEIMLMINALSEQYRQVFQLGVIDGYTHPEIAELLDISESTSRARLMRARNMIKEMLIKKNMTYEVAEARKVYSK